MCATACTCCATRSRWFKVCGRAEQIPGSTWEVLGKHFGRDLLQVFSRGGETPEVRPTDPLGFIRGNRGQAEAARGRWGLVGPGMDLQAAKKYATFNARAETVPTSRTYAEAYRHRRCLVPLSAFWEWPVVEGQKTRTRITRRDGLPLVVAGLWSSWTDDEGEHDSATVVTVEAGTDLQHVHDRQPLLLLSKDWQLWLGLGTGPLPTSAKALMWRPYPPGILQTTPEAS